MTDYTSLYKLIETLYSNYNGKSMLPDWFSVNLKTLLSKNITIEDWNSLQLNVKNVVGESSALYSFCNSLIPVIKELINSTAHTIKFNGNVLYLLDANGEIITSATLQIQYDMELSADSTNAVQNKVIKEALDKKLDKVTDPNSYIRVYGISPAGTQKAIPTSEAPYPGYVAMYGTEGQLSSLEPTDAYHVANKQYVDKAIENIDLKSDVVDIVHNYTDLESYDTSTLTADDIIKVLQDETHDNASSYYRWNTTFEYVGSEGPYYTQTQIDEKVDKKLDKVTEKTNRWQLYGVGSISTDMPNDGKTVNADSDATPYTVINRNHAGRAKINDPTEDKDIANKLYVDGRFDYVVFTKSSIIQNYPLEESDRLLLIDFYNKHYQKDKIPLFVVDKNGFTTTLRIAGTNLIHIFVWSDSQYPIVFMINLTQTNLKFNQPIGGHFHSILGQNSWVKDVKARIGVNTDNKLIITDETGNETPEQTPSVIVPPFSYSNNKWALTTGTFQTEAPTADKDVSNKSYVDNSINNINNSITETLKNYVPLASYNESLTNIANNTTDISNIKKVIPNQANENNQLADKNFVNSTINSNTAFFIGNFNTYADLETWQNENPSKATNNDYAYINSDEKHNGEAWRYQYVKKDNEVVGIWKAQFKVNDTPLTAEQLAAINSGATKETIDNLNTKMPTDINTTKDGALILEHNGEEIPEQKKIAYVVPYTLDQYKRYVGTNNYTIIQQNEVHIHDGKGRDSASYSFSGMTIDDIFANENTSYCLDKILYHKTENSPFDFSINLKNSYIKYSTSYITVDLVFGEPYLYVNISNPVATTKINFPQPKEDKNSLDLATTDDIDNKITEAIPVYDFTNMDPVFPDYLASEGEVQITDTDIQNKLPNLFNDVKNHKLATVLFKSTRESSYGDTYLTVIMTSAQTNIESYTSINTYSIYGLVNLAGSFAGVGPLYMVEITWGIEDAGAPLTYKIRYERMPTMPYIVPSTTISKVVYANNTSGKPTTLPYSSMSTSNSLVMYGSDGYFEVKYPTSYDHTANKKYVDDEIKKVKNSSNNSILLKRYKIPKFSSDTSSLILTCECFGNKVPFISTVSGTTTLDTMEQNLTSDTPVIEATLTSDAVNNPSNCIFKIGTTDSTDLTLTNATYLKIYYIGIGEGTSEDEFEGEYHEIIVQVNAGCTIGG